MHSAHNQKLNAISQFMKEGLQNNEHILLLTDEISKEIQFN